MEAASNMGGNALDKINEIETAKMIRIMRALNVLNSVGIVVVGVLAWLRLVTPNSGTSTNNGFSFSLLFTAFYTSFFGALLLCFELRVSASEDIIRKLFGFLFSYKGRMTFLLFTGSLCFGTYASVGESTPDMTAGMIVGIITCVNSIFNCYVIYAHPGFEGLDGMSDPTRNYTPPNPTGLAANPTQATTQQAQAATTNSFQPQKPQPTDNPFTATSTGASNPFAGGV
jgi:hypothetical protein